MTIEQVVRDVVAEVLKRLNPLNPLNNDRVVILAKADDENVAALQQQLGVPAEVGIGTDVTSASRVIIPLLNCTQMADLAAGRATNYRIQQVLARLLSGKSVEVYEFEYQRYSTTAPAELYDVYKAYQQTLQSFGLVDFVGKGKHSDPLFDKAVVTEEDILVAHKQGLRTLKLSATTLVTPLARDCAKAHGILLEKTERHDT